MTRPGRKANPHRPQLQPGSPATSCSNRVFPSGAAPSGRNREDAPTRLAWAGQFHSDRNWPDSPKQVRLGGAAQPGAPRKEPRACDKSWACPEGVALLTRPTGFARTVSSPEGNATSSTSAPSRGSSRQQGGFVGGTAQDRRSSERWPRWQAAGGWSRCFELSPSGEAFTAAQLGGGQATPRRGIFGSHVHGRACGVRVQRRNRRVLRIPTVAMAQPSSSGTDSKAAEPGFFGSQAKQQRGPLPRQNRSQGSSDTTAAVTRTPLNAKSPRSGLRTHNEVVMQPAGSHRPSPRGWWHRGSGSSALRCAAAPSGAAHA